MDEYADSWKLDAACRDHPYRDWWFPKKEGERHSGDAKLICDGCPVRAECLDYAFRHRIRHGIWGGLTEAERRRVAHGRRRHM